MKRDRLLSARNWKEKKLRNPVAVKLELGMIEELVDFKDGKLTF